MTYDINTLLISTSFICNQNGMIGNPNTAFTYLFLNAWASLLILPAMPMKPPLLDLTHSIWQGFY